MPESVSEVREQLDFKIKNPSFRGRVADIVLGLESPSELSEQTAQRIKFLRSGFKIHADSMTPEQKSAFRTLVFTPLVSATVTNFLEKGVLRDLLLEHLRHTKSGLQRERLGDIAAKNGIKIIEDSQNLGGYDEEGNPKRNSTNYGKVVEDVAGSLAIKLARNGINDPEEIEHEMISLSATRIAIDSLPKKTKENIKGKSLLDIKDQEIFFQRNIAIVTAQVVLDLLT